LEKELKLKIPVAHHKLKQNQKNKKLAKMMIMSMIKRLKIKMPHALEV
jgi:hypothetical protein